MSPEIKHERTYTKTLEKDRYRITKACCPSLGSIESVWKFCPYCGEKIDIVEVEEVTDIKVTEKDKS